MKKHYITSDKVGEFIVKMYAKGIRVDADPKSSELTVHLPNGGLEWIHVFTKSSFDELCGVFGNESSTNVDEQ